MNNKYNINDKVRISDPEHQRSGLRCVVVGITMPKGQVEQPVLGPSHSAKEKANRLTPVPEKKTRSEAGQPVYQLRTEDGHHEFDAREDQLSPA